MPGAGYSYKTAQAAYPHRYIMPVVEGILARAGAKTVFEIGCGNGAAAGRLASLGYDVTGIEPVETQGARVASENFPACRFEAASVYEDLSRFGRFDVVLSLEVVEHLYAPRRLAEEAARLVSPGGVVVVSTPYHGYLKNLALAAAGKWESHLQPLKEGGHVKFFSRATLGALFARAGLVEVEFHRVGRIPQFAKSMVCAYRPR